MNMFVNHFKQSNDQLVLGLAMVKRMSGLGQPPKSQKRLFYAVLFDEFQKVGLAPNQSALDNEAFC